MTELCFPTEQGSVRRPRNSAQAETELTSIRKYFVSTELGYWLAILPHSYRGCIQYLQPNTANYFEIGRDRFHPSHSTTQSMNAFSSIPV
jgi:hypothetical protein